MNTYNVIGTFTLYVQESMVYKYYLCRYSTDYTYGHLCCNFVLCDVFMHVIMNLILLVTCSNSLKIPIIVMWCLFGLLIME